MWRQPKPYGSRSRLFNAVFGLLLLLAPATAAADKVVLAFGDSLTAGYGLAEAEGFPRQLEARLRAEGLAVRVRNAGVSGDTTAGGRARLAWTLAEPADLVILSLGANDALRGIEPAVTKANLDAMLEELGKRKLKVLLAGMLAPRNLGDDYTKRFDTIYPELAKAHGVPLYPFFLAGVARQPELNQADGIHPNAAGVKRLVDDILPHVLALLR